MRQGGLHTHLCAAVAPSNSIEATVKESTMPPRGSGVAEPGVVRPHDANGGYEGGERDGGRARRGAEKGARALGRRMTSQRPRTPLTSTWERQGGVEQTARGLRPNLMSQVMRTQWG